MLLVDHGGQLRQLISPNTSSEPENDGYRVVFRTQSNIYDGAFLQKYLKFLEKSSIIDVYWVKDTPLG